MDPECVQRQDGKVFDITNLVITEQHRSPDYCCETGPCTLAETGELVLFRILPISDEALPSFRARWDGGSREPGKQERFELDIDIVGVSKAEKRKFEKGLDGYSGHHAKKIAADRHLYEARIATPRGRIFEATVSFSLARKMGFLASTAPQAGLKIERP